MDRLDDALEILDGAGPEYGGGLSNHGPMAAEALFTLGEPGAVVPWTERYRRKLGDEPAPGKPVERSAIPDALGQMRRYPDWLALFLEEFHEGPWEPAVDRWVYELAPGFAGAATHGIIRVGHAARSLARHDTPGRRKELARGFAYWAATHQTLPGKEGRPAGLPPAQALARVPRLAEDVRRTGSISQGLKLVEKLPDFPGVISLVEARASESFVSALGEVFARVFLAGTKASGRTIALVHAVTGPAAAGLLLPHVSPRTAARLSAFAWQAGAALYAVYGKPLGPPEVEAPRATPEALIAGAVKSGDEHAIKFTEGCLRLDAISPSPAFRSAASRAVELLSEP
ncbi:MAG TPA: questin oxidase family protein [Thermoanaerobaculia bacterium]|nr:questin oxidase family protein [Thermoanaerobaculia bacterium]